MPYSWHGRSTQYLGYSVYKYRLCDLFHVWTESSDYVSWIVVWIFIYVNQYGIIGTKVLFLIYCAILMAIV